MKYSFNCPCCGEKLIIDEDTLDCCHWFDYMEGGNK
mgnify:CR=1 FL=1